MLRRPLRPSTHLGDLTKRFGIRHVRLHNLVTPAVLPCFAIIVIVFARAIVTFVEESLGVA